LSSANHEKPTAATPLGVFTVDAALLIRAWDRWMEEATGIASHEASGRPLVDVVPSLAERGLLTRFEQVLQSGEVQVLAPAFHHYLIPCAPKTPSAHFDRMQQRVTLGALREAVRIVGVMVTIEDVTERLDEERALAADLRSADPIARDSAARRLAEAESLESPQAMTDALRHDDWRVRRSAVLGLTPHASRDMLASLLTALRLEHSDFNVLSSALQLLSVSEVDLTEPLAELLRDPEPDLRVQAALALGQQHHPAAVGALVDALRDPDVNVRFHAIEALGLLRAAEAADELAEIADSGDFFLSFPAVDALARIGDPRVVPQLLPLLSQPDLSETVAEALGEVGGADVVPHLAAVLNGGASAGPIVRALARLHARYEERYHGGAYVVDQFQSAIDSAGAATLLRAVADTGIDELRTYVLVLSWLRGPAVQDALTRLLGQPTIRTEVIEALVRQGAPVVPQLVGQFGAADPATRLASIVALGRLADRRATSALVRLLGENREETIAAAGALAKIGDPDAFEPLLRLLSDGDVTIRQAAIGALNSLGHPEMAVRIRGLLESDDARVRESAVRIAGYFGYPDALETMIARCSDPVEAVRRAALEHLPFFDDPRTLPTLVQALQADTPKARAAAAQGLAQVSGAAAIDALRRATGDPDSWVRYYAARSLAGHRDASVIPDLVELARQDGAMHVRIAALEAIGIIDGDQATETLVSYANGDEPELAAAALRGLGTISDERATTTLRSRIRDASPLLRSAAVEGLSRLSTDERVRLLAWTAGAEQDQAVAHTAIEALARLAKAGLQADNAVDALVELTTEPSRRQQAIAALSALPDTRIPRVTSALHRDPPVVRRALIGALGRMKHPDASAALRAALEDEDALVREEAVIALDRLGARGVSRIFSTLARQDPSKAVRRVAATALSRQHPASPSDER